MRGLGLVDVFGASRSCAADSPPAAVQLSGEGVQGASPSGMRSPGNALRESILSSRLRAVEPSGRERTRHFEPAASGFKAKPAISGCGGGLRR